MTEPHEYLGTVSYTHLDVYKRQELEVIAQELLEKEILFQSDLERLIGKRPFEQETNYQAYVNRRSREEAAIHEEAVKHAHELSEQADVAVETEVEGGATKA